MDDCFFPRCISLKNGGLCWNQEVPHVVYQPPLQPETFLYSIKGGSLCSVVMIKTLKKKTTHHRYALTIT